MTYSLANDGDLVEQRYWELFLRDEFPSYGKVWASYIVSLTGRPVHLWFKTNDELAEIGRGEEDICNAQLHYTTFTHIARVFDLKARLISRADEFIEAVVRLAAATDVADELLQRVTDPGRYSAWSEGPAARKAWRDANSYPMQHLRDYRNRLLHGRLVPFATVRQMEQLKGGLIVPQPPALRFPKIGKEVGYLDWRTFLGPSADPMPIVMHRDFAYAETIIGDAWTETLAYFEEEWATKLLPLVHAR